MSLLIFLGGVVIGVAATIIFTRKNKTYGFIDVDHNNDLCRVRITSEEVADRKNKTAVFRIIHDVDLSSREEQVL